MTSHHGRFDLTTGGHEALMPHHRDGEGEPLIRRAVPEDADQIVRLLVTVRTESIPDLPLAARSEEAVAPFVREVLLEQFEVWMAEVEGEAVGFMALVPPDQIGHLYVDAAHRGQGVGARLLALARRRFPEGLQVWTYQSNGDAQRFYKREGFAAVESADDRDGAGHSTPDLRMSWTPD